MWAWTLQAAIAAPVGYWHPDDLGPRSALFAATSEAMAEPFEARLGGVERLAAALRSYREALELLGARAPAEELARLDALEREFAAERAALEAFANQWLADYDEAFMTAVDRAIAGRDIAECAASVREGPILPGMPVRERKNPDCTGDDLNTELAAAVDQDPLLKQAVQEALSATWPEVAVPAAPQTPVGGGARWIDVHSLFLAGAREALRGIDRDDDLAREEIEAALENAPSPSQLEALKARAAKIEAATAGQRALLGEPVLAAAEKRAPKLWAGQPATGWCANPALLGGCVGEDATSALVAELLDDKKVAKAFP